MRWKQLGMKYAMALVSRASFDLGQQVAPHPWSFMAGALALGCFLKRLSGTRRI
jgi:hypothetical protein